MALLTGAIDADISGGDGAGFLDAAEDQIITACEARFATDEPLAGACAASRIIRMVEGLISLARNDLANCRADVVK
ncbi:MAG: hypothetical protein JSR99_09980 [Proteobacteria bacterium]|nr:hypothetical protein [Pseudomonadota bacterium]